MTTYIYFLIFVCICFALYFWRTSKSLHSYPDDHLLDLSDKNITILDKWYKDNLPNGLAYIDQEQLASTILNSLFEVNISKHKVVLGTNLLALYKNLTGNELDKKNHYDLAYLLGIEGEIAIIEDRVILDKMKNRINYDASKLYNLNETKLWAVIYKYLQELLSNRIRLLDPLDLKIEGQYLYLDDILAEQLNIKTCEGKIQLYCKQKEFNTLYKRLTINKKLEYNF